MWTVMQSNADIIFGGITVYLWTIENDSWRLCS